MRLVTNREKTVFPQLIAEVANCHGGNREYMTTLINQIGRADVEAIKFQPIRAGEFISFRHPMFSVFKHLEFDLELWKIFAKKVKQSKKLLGFDIYGEESLRIALECEADILKIHAMDFDNLEFIAEILNYRLPLLISAGGAKLQEIDRLIRVVRGHHICLLVGFQHYPTPVNESNLDRIEFLRKRYSCSVGFMDHVDRDNVFSLVLPCLALMKGAEVIEKHVYLRSMRTKYDWQSALDAKEINELKSLMLKTMAAKGQKCYVRSRIEADYFKKCRKNAVARRAMAIGDKLTLDNVEFLRGECPQGQTFLYRSDLKYVLSRKAKVKIKAGQTLTRELF
jgi:N,N'-diacetyllegionaminate synthase